MRLICRISAKYIISILINLCYNNSMLNKKRLSFSNIPAIRLISFYVINGKLAFVGLKNIVYLNQDLTLFEIKPLTASSDIIPQLRAKITRQATKTFNRTLHELGS